MPSVVNVHAAKGHLAKRLDRVAGGEEIVIARGGRPVARLSPLLETPRPRRPGLMRGRITVTGDFDAPLPKRLLTAFSHGAPEPPRRAR